MEKIFDIAKDSEKSWGVIAQGIDGNFEEFYSKVIGDLVDIDGISIARKVIGYYISQLGVPTNNSTYSYYAISNVGYLRVRGVASCYSGFPIVAFYSGSISPDNYMSEYTVMATLDYKNENYDIVIPKDCQTIVIVEATNKSLASSATLSKRSGGLEVQVNELSDNVKDNKARLSVLEKNVTDFGETTKAVSEFLDYEAEEIKKLSDFTLEGYYNSNNTDRTVASGYKSIELINVVEGQTIYWHKWITDYEKRSTQALACYDNDGLPYNGVSARINYQGLTTKDYVNGEFSFIVPSNCSQIGISTVLSWTFASEEDANIVIKDSSLSLTNKGKALVKNAVDVTDIGTDNSASYYLKGNSNIPTNTKSLGIIAAGQSNIDGRNSYSDLPSTFVNPNSKVKFCNNINGLFSDFQIVNGGNNNDWSFDAILYDILTNASYGNQQEIYVMKKSMGGTSIDKYGATDYHWTADYEFLDGKQYSLLRTFEQIIRAGISAQGSNFDIKAFIWHQGEGDADNADVASRYYDNLKNMLAYVRGVIGNPRLHFFCGSISNNNHANAYKDVINDALWKLQLEDGYFHCVDMSNALLEDSYHFNYKWSIYFGQKVYDLMIDYDIIAGTKIYPSEPE